MAKYVYTIRPIEHGMAMDYPSLHIPETYSPLVYNSRITQHSVKKRWGYNTADRSLGAPIYAIILYQTSDGSRYTLYLTDTDLCKRESGGTWSYLTQRYATGNISSISGATVTGSGTTWDAGMVGDYFILDVDHSSTSEPDTNWAKISAASTTSLTLSASYTGTTGAFTPGKTYKIRQIYSVPSNERWAWTFADDKFVFTNGNVNTQYWNGNVAAAMGAATDVNVTYAIKARYCTSYAERLLLADVYSGGSRNPYLVLWSSNTDITAFDPGANPTAGSKEFIETDDYLMGMARIGPYISIYKRDNIVLGERTGTSTDPFLFSIIRPGIGCRAPYSLIEATGTNCFLGKDDFYIMRGDYPESIGTNMRQKFYDWVPETEAQNTWGWYSLLENEINWIARTTAGKMAFSWDYKHNEWTTYQFAHDITGAGSGAI